MQKQSHLDMIRPNLVVLLSLIAMASSRTGELDNGKLQFKISGRNLPDKDDGLGTTDGYVEVYYTEAGASKEVKLKRSETISNSENPDWSTVFELDYDRSKNQQLHFLIWDEDNFRTDDNVGKAWMDVNNFVDKGQLANVPVYKHGYLVVQSVDAKKSGVAPRSWPDTEILKFKLSATNLPDKDKLGTIDPYAEVFYADGITGKEVKIGRTSTISNEKSPNWSETFDFQYDAKKNQRWIVRIWDHDNLREDDKGGVGYVDLEDYMRRGQTITVNLSKRGKLTITRA